MPHANSLLTNQITHLVQEKKRAASKPRSRYATTRIGAQPYSATDRHTRYQIIAGERRFRAAQEAGLNEIPANLHAMDETRKSFRQIAARFSSISATAAIQPFQKLANVSPPQSRLCMMQMR
jgi:hypothetical protein